MGLMDRQMKSGDIVRIQKGRDEHTYNIIYSHGTLLMDYEELAELFVKAYGKTIYCNSIYVDGIERQLYKLPEDEFYRLVQGKSFTVYIDDDVFTLRNYPVDNAAAVIGGILCSECYEMSLTTDARFVRTRCIQFEEVKQTIENS